MLRATIEIVPYGQEDHPNRREIGVMDIGNMDMAEGECPYISTLTCDGRQPPKNRTVQLKHDRRDGAWELIRKCLEKHDA